jgi:hypothetical protein
MNQKNVAYTPLANLDNPKIAEHIYTHTHTHTHTRAHAHSHRPSLARNSFIVNRLQNGVKIILHTLSCPYLAFGRYRFRILLT